VSPHAQVAAARYPFFRSWLRNRQNRHLVPSISIFQKQLIYFPRVSATWRVKTRLEYHFP